MIHKFPYATAWSNFWAAPGELALSQQAERKGAAAGSSVKLSDNETGNEYQLEELKEKAWQQLQVPDKAVLQSICQLLMTTHNM